MKQTGTLFFTMFTLSAFTFGGGFAIIPMMRKKFVEKLNWLTEEEMLNAIAIAHSSPGAVTVNVAAQLGYKLSGPRGMAAAVAGTLVPPLVTLSLISYFYEAFKSARVIAAFLQGMKPGVAAMIVWSVLSMGRAALKDRHAFDAAVILLAFALSLLGVNATLILAVCAVLGLVKRGRGA